MRRRFSIAPTAILYANAYVVAVKIKGSDIDLFSTTA
jgi:hypothetical protein